MQATRIAPVPLSAGARPWDVARDAIRRSGLPTLLKAIGNRHRPGPLPNVLLVTTPRSGSTWLMELIWGQPGFKCCDEPLNLRRPAARKGSGISTWQELYSKAGAAKILRYFEGICSGRSHGADAMPFSGKYYRYNTNRIVFKLLHGGESMVAELARACDARVVILLRHPVAVALSRRALPRLPAFRTGEIAERFSPAQHAVAERIVSGGSALERGVLAWCFENALLLDKPRPEWALVTYEQLVLDPGPAVALLAERLVLTDRNLILSHLGEAAGNQGKSDAETRRILAQQGDSDRRALVSKWRNKVEPAEEAAAMRTLEVFGIDAYRPGRMLPASAYWIGGQPPELD